MWTFDEHGLLRRGSALESGVSERDFDGAVRSKELLRVARGVYIDGAEVAGKPRYRQEQIKYRARCLAVAAAREGEQVLSHESAAAVHGLPMLEPDRRFVHSMRGQPSGGNRKKRRSVVHSGKVRDEDVVEVSGVRVTNVARAAADVARTSDFPRALAVLDAALRQGVARADLAEQLASPRKGVAGARFALRYADGRSANPGESWSRAQIISARLPLPELQVEYIVEGKSVFVDFDWENKVVGEFDGVWKYGRDYLGAGEAPADVVAEKLREDGLRRLGLDVARWTYADLRADRTVDRLRERLSAANLPPL